MKAVQSLITRCWLETIIIIIAILPFLFGSEYLMAMMIFWFFYIAIAEAWNLLCGYTGLVSLGQQSFIGLGGYTLAVSSIYWGLPPLAGVILGGVFSALFACVIGLPLKDERFLFRRW